LNIPAPVETLISSSKETIASILDNPVPNKYNLSSPLVQAINSLQSKSDLIIKPADKGWAVVVWRRDLYIKEALRKLDNCDHYIEISSDPTKDDKPIRNIISDLIHSDSLPIQAHGLCVQESVCSRFYVLAKIHKSQIIKADQMSRPLATNSPTFTNYATHTLRKLH